MTASRSWYPTARGLRPARFTDERSDRISYLCCGVRIDTLTLAQSATTIIAGAEARNPITVCLRTAYTLSLGWKRPDLRASLNFADLNLADGVPLAWLTRRISMDSGNTGVRGSDLMLKVFDSGRKIGLRHFFFGADEETLRLMTGHLSSRFVGLDIAGSDAPPADQVMTDEDVGAAVRRMQAAEPDVVWFGLDMHDELFHRFAKQFAGPTVSVGAAFHSFTVPPVRKPLLLHSLKYGRRPSPLRLVHKGRRAWNRHVRGSGSLFRGILAEGTMTEFRSGSVAEEVDSTPPRVIVLMASFNRREETLRCLESVLRPDHHAMVRIVLVDDCSEDGTAEAVGIAYPEVTVVKGTGALYWAGGMRVAFEHAHYMPFDYLLWLNDDVTLTDSALNHLVQTERQLRASRGPVIVVGALQDPRTGLTAYSGVRRRGLNRTRFFRIPPGEAPRRAETMNGNVVLVPRDVVERLDTFDPAFAHGIADFDYGLRATSAGVEVWVAPRFVGHCSRNAVQEETRTAKENLRAVMSLKRIPPSGWLVFTRRHAGRWWPLFFVAPYARAALRRHK